MRRGKGKILLAEGNRGAGGAIPSGGVIAETEACLLFEFDGYLSIWYCKREELPLDLKYNYGSAGKGAAGENIRFGASAA